MVAGIQQDHDKRSTPRAIPAEGGIFVQFQPGSFRHWDRRFSCQTAGSPGFVKEPLLLLLFRSNQLRKGIGQFKPGRILEFESLCNGRIVFLQAGQGCAFCRVVVNEGGWFFVPNRGSIFSDHHSSNKIRFHGFVQAYFP